MEHEDGGHENKDHKDGDGDRDGDGDYEDETDTMETEDGRRRPSGPRAREEEP